MKRGLIVAAAMVLAGCSTVSQWTATGGSRADGVVRLSYDLGPFQKSGVNEAQAIELATQRCRAWGFTGAEAFGGEVRQCTHPGQFGSCDAYHVMKDYQCTGDSAGGQ